MTPGKSPAGKRFNFNHTGSMLYPATPSRAISVYIPAKYVDGTPAPVMVVMDGAGSQFLRAQAGLDNLSQSTDPTRQVPAFVLVEVANDQRSIELDTMCDLWARYVAEEVFPAVESNAATKAGRIPHQDVEPVPVLITEVEVPISSECGRNRQHRPGAGNEQPRGVASDRPRRHHDASGFVSIGRRAAWRQSGIGLED